MPPNPGITTNMREEHSYHHGVGGGGQWAHIPMRAHSSNFPSRMCSKEKGRNLKPVPL